MAERSRLCANGREELCANGRVRLCDADGCWLKQSEADPGPQSIQVVTSGIVICPGDGKCVGQTAWDSRRWYEFPGGLNSVFTATFDPVWQGYTLIIGTLWTQAYYSPNPGGHCEFPLGDPVAEDVRLWVPTVGSKGVFIYSPSGDLFAGNFNCRSQPPQVVANIMPPCNSEFSMDGLSGSATLSEA